MQIRIIRRTRKSQNTHIRPQKPRKKHPQILTKMQKNVLCVSRVLVAKKVLASLNLSDTRVRQQLVCQGFKGWSACCGTAVWLRRGGVVLWRGEGGMRGVHSRLNFSWFFFTISNLTGQIFEDHCISYINFLKEKSQTSSKFVIG